MTALPCSAVASLTARSSPAHERALHLALRARNHAAVERLINNPRVDINLRCHRGCSPLMSAVEHGSDLGVTRLLTARSGPQRSISDLHSPRSAVTPPSVAIYPTTAITASVWDGQQFADSATPQGRSCDVNATYTCRGSNPRTSCLSLACHVPSALTSPTVAHCVMAATNRAGRRYTWPCARAIHACRASPRG